MISSCRAGLAFLGFGTALGLIALPSALEGQSASMLSPQVQEFVSVAGPVIALTNVQLIDGSGAAPVRNQTIVIRNGRVAAVGPTGRVQVPSGAEVLKLDGHTVIPGMIGMHDHLFYNTSRRSVQLNFSGPRLYLAAGVTTIRTTGSQAPYGEINLKKAIEKGEAVGPRIHITGPYITGGSGQSSMHRVDTGDDARRVVRYWSAEGATWFKAYTEISREALGAAINEAHKQGMKVTGHLCSISFREAVALGIDNLEHGFLTNTDYDPEKVPDQCPMGFVARLAEVDMDSPEVRATIDDMLRNNVSMTSTVAVFETFVPNRPFLEDRSLDVMSPEVREEVLQMYNQITDNSETTPAMIQAYGKAFVKALEFEYQFVKAGGILGAGVDATGYGAVLPGFGDQRNYELLLEAGLAPAEVVQVLSANGAKILGVYDDVGSIERGKYADLVVLEGDLLSDPAAIRNVTTVFKDGVGYDSKKLIASVKGEVGVR